MTAHLTVRADRRGQLLLVRLFGELDIATSSRLADAVRSAPEDVDEAVIDLRELDFIDCAGVRALVTTVRQFEVHGSTPHLIAGRDRVQRVFELTGIEPGLPFVPGGC